MSFTIYYSARRSSPLSGEEQETVQRIVEKYSVDSRIKRFVQTGEGLNWESFCLFTTDQFSADDVILEGATKLPDNSDDAAATGLQHWCNALSALRLAIHKSLWSVRVEDQEIAWDYLKDCYDPSQ